MKKFKNLGAVAATGAFAAVLALAGCSGTSSSTTSGSTADEGSATTASSEVKLVTDGKLTVGTSAEYEPFEYMEDGEYKGFDLELIADIAEELGLEVEYKNVDFDSLVAGVSSGTKYDCSIAAMTVTPERKKEVDFSDSYYMDDQAIVTTTDNTTVTADNYADELNKEGVKIAVQSGSTAEAFAEENFPNAELVSFKNAVDCFSALQASKADALVTNRSVAAQLTASSFDNCQVIKMISTGEEYAIAISKDNPALTEQINEALQKLTDDGTVDELMEKYNIK